MNVNEINSLIQIIQTVILCIQFIALHIKNQHHLKQLKRIENSLREREAVSLNNGEETSSRSTDTHLR